MLHVWIVFLLAFAINLWQNVVRTHGAHENGKDFKVLHVVFLGGHRQNILVTGCGKCWIVFCCVPDICLNGKRFLSCRFQRFLTGGVFTKKTCRKCETHPKEFEKHVESEAFQINNLCVDGTSKL